jgi:DNA-binding IclR family transcriptional regulator
MSVSGPAKKWSDADLLFLVATAPEPFITATELTDRTGYTRENVRTRLNNLVESGYLEAKTVGASAKIYWLTPTGRRRAPESARQS